MAKLIKTVRVNDKMQRGYRYTLTAPVGRNFDPDFRPELTPKEMLALGVFCGKYLTDCRKEFPASWLRPLPSSAPSGRDCALNYFGVDASQPPVDLPQRQGWIHPDDPRGWFQWVLPLLCRPPHPGRGRAPDQALEGDPAACRANANKTVSRAMYFAANASGRLAALGL